jgi:hypothetical protein
MHLVSDLEDVATPIIKLRINRGGRPARIHERLKRNPLFAS